jgi:hypothetical protein
MARQYSCKPGRASGATGWDAVSTICQAPANANSLLPVPGSISNGAAAGTVYFDNGFVLRQAEAISGDGFECGD